MGISVASRSKTDSASNTDLCESRGTRSILRLEEDPNLTILRRLSAKIAARMPLVLRESQVHEESHEELRPMHRRFLTCRSPKTNFLKIEIASPLSLMRT